MHSLEGIFDRVKRYFRFSMMEIWKYLIIAVVFAFVLSFREWGVDKLNVIFGLFNALNAFIIVIMSIMVHETAHRLYAIHIGYRAEHRSWKLGIFITLFLAFLTNGVVPFVAYGGVVIHHLAVQRLGKFRYGLNMFDHALISLMGPMANIILAMIFKLLMPLNPILIQKAILINLMLSLFNMLPIPPLDGADVFFASRLLYVFSAGFMLGISAMIFYLPGVLYSILVGLGLGAIFWLFFATKIDKEF